MLDVRKNIVHWSIYTWSSWISKTFAPGMEKIRLKFLKMIETTTKNDIHHERWRSFLFIRNYYERKTEQIWNIQKLSDNMNNVTLLRCRTNSIIYYIMRQIFRLFHANTRRNKKTAVTVLAIEKKTNITMHIFSVYNLVN